MRKKLQNMMKGPVNDSFLFCFAACGALIFIATGSLISTLVEIIFY